MKETLEQRQDRIYSGFLQFCKENNYSAISAKEEIVNNRTKIKYMCPKHGERETTYSSIISSKRCRRCAYSERKTRWDDNKEERIDNLFNRVLNKCVENGYRLISTKDDIKTYHSYVEYECPKHGNHRITICNLNSGKKCPECQAEKSSQRMRSSVSDVVQKIESCGGKVLNPEEYKGNAERNLQITCPRCGNVFVTSLVLFTQHGGQLCQDCYRKESIGENRVRKYLEDNNISYVPEHWFEDCRDKHPLRFDFYLPNLNTVIEFDGEQHYREKHYFTSQRLHDLQRHDEMKNKYCKDKGIKMIRIPYWRLSSTEKILDKELST